MVLLSMLPLAVTSFEFDKVLGVFHAVSRPGDLKAQLRQIDQPITRAQYKLNHLCEELGLTKSYVDSIAQRVCEKPLHKLKATDYPHLLGCIDLPPEPSTEEN